MTSIIILLMPFLIRGTLKLIFFFSCLRVLVAETVTNKIRNGDYRLIPPNLPVLFQVQEFFRRYIRGGMRQKRYESVDSSRLRVQSSKVTADGYWMLDTGYSMLDTWYSMLDTRYSMLDTRYSMKLVTGRWLLVTGNGLQRAWGIANRAVKSIVQG